MGQLDRVVPAVLLGVGLRFLDGRESGASPAAWCRASWSSPSAGRCLGAGSRSSTHSWVLRCAGLHRRLGRLEDANLHEPRILPCSGPWSGRPDLNRRPSAPKADALPDCATPRRKDLLGAALSTSARDGSKAQIQGATLRHVRPDTPRKAAPAAPPVNVLGGTLQPCSIHPVTGFYRDGCCNTGADDVGLHTVCVGHDDGEFLAFSKSHGNDLSTPMPQYGFAGLNPGDRWCLCAAAGRRRSTPAPPRRSCSRPRTP